MADQFPDSRFRWNDGSTARLSSPKADTYLISSFPRRRESMIRYPYLLSYYNFKMLVIDTLLYIVLSDGAVFPSYHSE